MEERFIHVQRTARYHVLGTVEAAPAIWIVVHGYGHLARYFLRSFEGLEDQAAIVAPEGLSRFYLDEEHSRVGATWMTREDRLHEIDDHVAYLDAVTDELKRTAMPGAALNVLGFSQGVATVARWSLRTRHRIGRLVLWAGSLPPELDREALQAWRGTHVDLVAGDKDPLVKEEVLAAAAQRLSAADVPHTLHRYAGDHKLEPVLLRRLIAQR
jgi:predicted esterase